MSRLTSRASAPWAALALFVAALLVVSWQRWGNPTSDPGLDLVVAAGWLHGLEPYSDIRYFYGPLGIAGMSAMFAVFGTSLSTAFAYGLLQTAVIAELWRRVARRWLPGPVVAAGLAVVLAIGFSGSLFNFQLPHTASATTGLMALLAVLLAVSHQRYGWAGVAIGLAALTRPEFLAFAFAALGGAALGLLREQGWRAALRALLWAVPGTLLVGGIVLGWFAHAAGASNLFTENLFPVEFVRTVGGRFEEAWHPYDLPSVGTLLMRGVVIAGGAWTVLAVAEGWGYARAAGVPAARVVRVVAGPVAVFVAALAAAAVVATALGVLGGEASGPVRGTARDAGRLLLPMTALPAISLTVLAVAAWRWLRAEASPLGGAWSADLALIATAAACTLRAYGSFSTDIYATYWAPPAVLLAAILVYRGAGRLGAPQIRVSGGLLAVAAVALAVHAWIGRYDDLTFKVHSPHGSYRADASAGPNTQRVVDLLAPLVREREPMLVLPQEPGFQFLLGTRPALYNDTFLPGTLPDAATDDAAARQFLRVRPRFVIEASRSLAAWGFDRSGVDTNVALTNAVKRHYCVLAVFGDPDRPAGSDFPATAFTVYARLNGAPIPDAELQAPAGAPQQALPAPPAPRC